MKKIMSLLLCITLLPTFAAFAKDADMLVYESFDGYATNSAETILSQRGDPNIRVIEDGKNNKALFIPTDAMTNVLSCDISGEPDMFVLSVKLKYTGAASSVRFTISDQGNQEYIPFTVRNDGKIVLSSGKVAGGVGSGAYTQIDVGYNTATQRCFVFINGRERVREHIISTALTCPSKLTVRTFVGEDNSAVIMDDLAIYRGNEPVNIKKNVKYNTESVDFTPINMKDRAPVVIVNNDFNSKTKALNGLAAYNKGNDIKYLQLDDGNGCMLMDKTLSDTDPFVNITVTGAEAVTDFVLEVDVASDKLGSTLYLFNVRNDLTGWGQTFRITPGGDIITYLGKSVAKIAKGEFVKLAAVYKTAQNTFDVYVNKSKVMENVPIAVKSFGTLTEIRLQQMPNQGNGRILLDNLRIYEGDTPYSLAENTEDTYSVLPGDTDDLSKLSGVTAFHDKGKYYVAGNVKTESSAYPYYDGDCLMIPKEIISAAIRSEVSCDEASGEISVGNIAKLHLGSRDASVGNAAVILDKEPVIKDEVLYLPAKSVTEKVLNKRYFRHETGLVVLSDSPFKYENDESILKQLSTYVFFMRPQYDKIQELYDNSKYKNVHPRILATAEDFERIKENLKTDSRLSEWTANVISIADKYLSVEPQSVHYSDGAMLEVAHSIGNRLLALSYAWKITGDTKYAKRAWEEMENAANYPDWNPSHFLDTGEMTYIMGLAYDWCFDYLNEEQRKIICDAIRDFGLEAGRAQYQGRAQGTDFVKQAMNWNAVCNGGLITGACAIMDEEPAAAKYTIVNGLRSFEYMITEFAPEGAWVEGVGYWEYAVKFMSFMVDSMNTTLGTDFDIPKYTGIDKTAEFVFGLIGNCGYNNFHDAGTEDELSKWLQWLGKYYQNEKIAGTYLKLFDMKNMSGNVFDCLYYDPKLVRESREDYSLDCTTKVTETGSMRSSWSDPSGMWLAYSGGANTVNHYHLDEGSFVLDMMGERWAIDMGGDIMSYLSTFSGKRYDLFRIRPESHNTLVINPDEGPGQELSAYCPIIRAESKKRGAFQVMDLTSAYASQTKSAIRGFMLTDDRRTAVIRDEIELENKSDVYWLMHTPAEVNIVSSDTAILEKNGKKMQVKILVENAEAEFTDTTVQPFPNSPKIEGQVSNASFRRVGIKVSGAGKIAISVRITPADEYTAELPFACGSIDSWQIPDGEVTQVPYANAIYIDGKLIHNFSSGRNAYTVKLENESDPIGQISVDCGAYTLEALQTASKAGESAVYKISQPDGKYRKLTISFEKLGTLDSVDGRKRLVPAELFASANPEPHNSDKNANDGDLNTNWAANGEQTLTYDFARNVKIGAFALSTMRADTRSYKFDIEISNDGKTWQNIYSGATTPGTQGYEVFEIPAVEASYIRYAGKGNNENSWNSIKEFAVLGEKE